MKLSARKQIKQNLIHTQVTLQYILQRLNEQIGMLQKHMQTLHMQGLMPQKWKNLQQMEILRLMELKQLFTHILVVVQILMEQLRVMLVLVM